MKTTRVLRGMLLGVALAATGCLVAADPSEFDGVEDFDVEEDQGLGALGNSWCPSGFSHDSTYRLCVSATEAQGPFTQAMINSCTSRGGGSACNNARWAVGFAKSIRGTGTCMPGASLDSAKGVCVEGTNAFGPFSAAQVDYCVNNGGGEVCQTMRWAKGFIPDKTNKVCPSGWDYDYTWKMCVSATEALGPFTSSMASACKASGGGSICEGSPWNRQLARNLRGTATCPSGASWDSTRGVCREGTNVFGPFTQAQIDKCKALGGGTTCSASMRWHQNFVPASGSTGGTSSFPLAVPYLYQYNNYYNPGGTCQNTSIAMVLRYLGRTTHPDDIYEAYGNDLGKSPSGVAQIIRAYGYEAHYTTAGTTAGIKRQLDAGRPVIVHGWFTNGGHVIVITGYSSAGWWVNDPAGKWAQCVGCGYPNRTSTNGKAAFYGASAMLDAIGPEGTIWFTAASKTAFSL